MRKGIFTEDNLAGKILLISILINMAVLCSAQFGGGAGTVQNPYMIVTAEHLNNIRNYLGEGHRNTYFVQREHIDLGVAPWNTGSGWNPIGNRNINPFYGNYDGGYYEIRNLTIDSSIFGLDEGLFGNTNEAIINRVIITNANITCGFYGGGLVGYADNTTIRDCSFQGNIEGFFYVGGLVGYMIGNSSIINSYTTGKIVAAAADSYVGGLIGVKIQTSISDSYSTMAVTGVDRYIGGLVGINWSGNIFRSYSAGYVRATHPAGGVGGLVGAFNAGSITASFWNVETSGQNESAGGAEGLTSAQMVSRTHYENTGWNFDGNWGIEAGRSYPFLDWQQSYGSHNIPAPYRLAATVNNEEREVDLTWQIYSAPVRFHIYRNGDNIAQVDYPNNRYLDVDVPQMFNLDYYVTAVFIEGNREPETEPSNVVKVMLTVDFPGGSGTENDPYQVNSPATLALMGQYLDAHFIQTADIDLNIAPWNSGQGWIAIGNTRNSSFRGVYDGNGFIISNLMINRPLDSAQALFRYTNNAYLKNIGLVNVDIRGYGNVAGIVAYAEAYTRIERSFISGRLSSETGVAGIVSRLRGNQPMSYVVDCYSAAELITNSSDLYTEVGGIVGYRMQGTVTRNLVTGPIYANPEATVVGAIIGRSTTSVDIADNYWDRETTFQIRGGTGVGAGNSTDELLQQDTFVGFDFNNVWRIEEGRSYPFLQWEGNQANEHSVPGLLPPRDFSAIGSDSIIDLTWRAPNNITGVPDGYNLYRDGNRLNDVLIIVNEYRDTGLTNFQAYLYHLTAVYDGQESNRTLFLKGVPSHFGGGDGTQADPFLITTAEQLNGMRHLPANHYQLAAHINLDIPPFNEGAGWEPIELLSGAFNGNGYTISNLTINRPDLGNVGFWRVVGLVGQTPAKVQNLALKEVNITGGNSTGAISGLLANGSVSNCYTTGNVTGVNKVGGFFGSAGSTRTSISNSYSGANVRVSGREWMDLSGGGLVGEAMQMSIDNCYVMGRISYEIDEGGYQIVSIGPFVGNQTMSSTIVNCYFNKETTGLEDFHSSMAKSSEEMTKRETFQNWDFEERWNIGHNDSETYPWLQMQDEPIINNHPAEITLTASITPVSLVSLSWSIPSLGVPDGYNIYKDNELYGSVDSYSNSYLDNNAANWTRYSYYVTANYGSYETNRSNSSFATPVPNGFPYGLGTDEDPYQISTALHLSNIRYNPQAAYIQKEDIDLIIVPNWEPIGSSSEEMIFTGIFNGNGKKISNLTLDRPETDAVGLFGVVGKADNGAVIRNVNLENITVTGRRSIGGLAGVIFGDTIIDSCQVSGFIRSNSEFSNIYIGGLVGYNQNSRIINCSAQGWVEALNDYVGGLVGFNYEGIIEDSYATANVRGAKYVGGFAGYHRGTIANCYSSGAVEGTNRFIGGFVGYTNNGNIKNSYSRGVVSSPGIYDNIGGFCGYHSSGMITHSYWDVQSSNLDISAAGEGRTTEGMTYPYDAETYVGWDFEDIWAADINYDINEGYPYLHRKTFLSFEEELLEMPHFVTLTNYPNPFNPQTTIYFSIPRDGDVSLHIYNIRGQFIKILYDSYTEAGHHSHIWDGKNSRGISLSSGVYLYRLITEDESIIRKMMIVK